MNYRILNEESRNFDKLAILGEKMRSIVNFWRHFPLALKKGRALTLESTAIPTRKEHCSCETMAAAVRISWKYFAFAIIIAIFTVHLRWISRVVQIRTLDTHETEKLLLGQFGAPSLISSSSSLSPSPSPSHPPRLEANETFSACLLIMDDNHRLPEWLTYHYFALNLRYLVVAVDPSSKTSPTHIFDRWRHAKLMNIVEWTDTNFTARDLSRRKSHKKKNIALHKHRQWLFYNACTRHLKHQNRRWTVYIDADEFFSVNEVLIPDAQQRMNRPGSIPQILDELRKDTNGTLPQSDFYQQNRSCYTVPRRLYSAKESTPEEIQKGVPTGYNPTHFDTLRYRFRAEDPFGRNGYCKSIIDVAQVPEKLIKNFDSIAGTTHRPIRVMCPSQYVEYKFPIGIHHYLGSMEAFLFRDDARKNDVKTESVWKKKALQSQGGTDDELRLWLDGFVKFVGKEMASILLEGAGILPKLSE